MLVPDNPLFGPPPSEVTPNDSDNAKAVIFKRRNAFSYVRPPYSSSCSPSSRASSKSCLRMRRELKDHVASIDRCRLHYARSHFRVGKRRPRSRNHSGRSLGLRPLARVQAEPTVAEPYQTLCSVPITRCYRYGSSGTRYGCISSENLAGLKRPAIKVLFLAPTPFRVF